MASQTFYFFPRLPAELRQLIWEAAIHLGRRGGGGIQYFHFFDQSQLAHNKPNLISLLPIIKQNSRESYVVGVPKSDHDGNANRSAYLWDTGLWTACWESRKIISKRSNVQQLLHSRHRPSQKYFTASQAGAEIQHRLAYTTLSRSLCSDDGTEWPLVMHPSDDAVKLSLETMCDWVAKDRFHSLEQIFSCLPPFSSHANGCKPMWNFAVEFDPSWNVDMPLHLVDILKEPSPRGFVANLFQRLSRSRRGCIILLIDRGEHPVAEKHDAGWKHRWKIPEVYYDCDEEYLVTTTMHPEHDHKSAACFIQNLWGLYGKPRSPLFLSRFGILRPKRKL